MIYSNASSIDLESAVVIQFFNAKHQLNAIKKSPRPTHCPLDMSTEPNSKRLPTSTKTPSVTSRPLKIPNLENWHTMNILLAISSSSQFLGDAAHYMESYGSKIKTIYVELHGYAHRHGPSQGEESDQFIGRKAVLEKLASLLAPTKDWSGTYLVAGYRGMGKTSLVRKAIKEATKKHGADLLDIEISLSQENLDERDVIRLLSRRLLEKYTSRRKMSAGRLPFLRGLPLPLFMIAIAVAAFCLGFSREHFQSTCPPGEKVSVIANLSPLAYSLLDIVGGLLLGWSIFRLIRALIAKMGYGTHRQILTRLSALIRNMESETTTELNAKSDGILNLGFLSQKRFSQRLNAKEAETELMSILEAIKNLPSKRSVPKILFVLDELDKIQTSGTRSAADLEKLGFGLDFLSDESRKRLDVITRILGNLKHFFNDANAKFIFIAGREMYDAALADISDRDTFVGSIFDEVLYVPSFLKDDHAREIGGITGMTEHFLARYLVPKDLWPQHGEGLTSLQNYAELIRFSNGVFEGAMESHRDWLYSKPMAKLIETNLKNPEGHDIRTKLLENYNKGLDNKQIGSELASLGNNETALQSYIVDKQREISKVLSTLQNFVTFLTYRSNGSPKKLMQLIEEFIVTSEDSKLRGKGEVLNPLLVSSDTNAPRFFLKFGYEDQYRIGLTSRIFRPFLIRNSRHSGAFDDKYLVATSYLLDHILKYHNSSFNWWNLELTPDVISVHKPPQIRTLIESIVHQLENSLLRRTSAGLFQYRFRRRNQLEIAFLTKISDSDSAAFTFSLDESQAIKRHYHAKLQEAIKLSAGIPPAISNGYINAVSMYHAILGDLYFADQQYQDAEAHYSQAVHALRFQDFMKVHPQLFLTMIRERLKEGLSLEHQKYHDKAIAHYNSVSSIILEYFTSNSEWRNHHLLDSIGPSQAPNSDFRLGFSLSLKGLIEFMPVFWQSLVARLHAIEKQSPTGVSYRDILESERIYDLISKAILMQDETEDYLNRAKYHLAVGQVLYFKNGVALIDSKYTSSVLESANWNEKHLGHTYHVLQKIKGETQSPAFPTSGYLEYLKSLAFVLKRANALRKFTPNSDCFEDDYDKSLEKWLNPQAGAAATKEGIFDLLMNKDTPHYNLLTAGLITAKNIIDAHPINQVKMQGKAQNGASATTPPIEHLFERNFLETFAEVLTRIGDIGLCRIDDHIIHDEKEKAKYGITNQLAPVDWNSLNIFFEKGDSLNYQLRLNRIAGCYIMSARLFKVAGNHKGHAYCLRKLLIFIHEIVLSSKRPVLEGETKKFELGESSSITKLLVSHILPEKMSSLATSNGQSNRPQVLKSLQNLGFGIDSEDEKQLRQSFQASTSNADLSEGIFVAVRTLFHIGAFEKPELLYQHSIHPNSSVLGMFERFQELEFKSQLNYRASTKLKIGDKNLHAILYYFYEVRMSTHVIAEDCPSKGSGIAKAIDSSYKNPFDNEKWEKTTVSTKAKGYATELKNDSGNGLELAADLIADSIYCLFEAVRIMNVFEPSFVMRFTFLGMLNRRLGQWLTLFAGARELARLRNEKGDDDPFIIFAKRIELKVEKLVGKRHKTVYDPTNFFFLAMENFRNAMELHTGGNTYKTMINDMYFLEDDLGDMHSHFSAAIERSMITGTRLAMEIEKLAKLEKISAAHSPQGFTELMSVDAGTGLLIPEIVTRIQRTNQTSPAPHVDPPSPAS